MTKQKKSSGPMNELEAALEKFEPAWADFAFALRPKQVGRPYRRDPEGGKAHWKTHGLRDDINMLNSYRDRVAAGEKVAVFDALIFCAKENVPMPYWLSTALLDAGEALMREPQRGKQPENFHALLGLESRYPSSAKKALKARRDLKLRVALWVRVHELQLDGLSKEKAIEKAIEVLKFPYQQRKAREMFDEQELIQNRHIDAMQGVTRKRIK